ncbi:MAG: Ig-like domain-containing protein [Ruminococcus sp.]
MSSDNSIATVDDYGTITAVSEGICTVTVVMMDSDENISVTVNVK